MDSVDQEGCGGGEEELLNSNNWEETGIPGIISQLVVKKGDSLTTDSVIGEEV